MTIRCGDCGVVASKATPLREVESVYLGRPGSISSGRPLDYRCVNKDACNRRRKLQGKATDDAV